MKNIVKAFIDAFKFTFIKKKFYRKLLAYGCIIGGMKYDKGGPSIEDWKSNDKYWTGELPSIFNLDAIVDEMNNQHNDINKLFKLNVNVWNRDEVRCLMNTFETAHNGFSRVNNKDFTIMETCAKIMNWIDSSVWKHFNISYHMYKEDMKNV